MYTHALSNYQYKTKQGVKAHHKGIDYQKVLKYSCKVLYPALRSNKECGWIEHGNESQALISDASSNIQMYTKREKAIEKKNEQNRQFQWDLEFRMS